MLVNVKVTGKLRTFIQPDVSEMLNLLMVVMTTALKHLVDV